MNDEHEVQRLRNALASIALCAHDSTSSASEKVDHMARQARGALDPQRLELAPGERFEPFRELEHLQRLTLQPGEALLVTTTAKMSMDQMARLREHMHSALPHGCKVLILAGADFKVGVIDPRALTKCDGNHGGPPCADPDCWARP